MSTGTQQLRGTFRLIDGEKTTKDKNQIDMLHGPLLKKMITFALPLALGSILQMVFNMTDTAVIGQFVGPDAMAAVGSTSPIVSMLVSMLVGISVGANVVIARFIGQRKSEKVHYAVHTTVALAIVLGFVLMAAGEILSVPLLKITGVPPDVMNLAKLYMRIFFAGIPCAVVYNFCASVLRSKGDSKRPLCILAFSGCINVALNLILVIVFHMSVAGVAVATSIANANSMIIVMLLLSKENKPFKLCKKDIALDKQIVKGILYIGIPAGIQGTVFAVSNTIIQAGINSLGSVMIAGSAGARFFEGIGAFSLASFSQMTVTFMGQNFGASNIERCKKIYKRAMLSSLLFCFTIDMICILFRVPLMSLFTDDPNVIAAGTLRIVRMMLIQWIAVGYEISGAALRGMGHSVMPMIMTLIGTCVLRIIWVAFFFPLNPKLEWLLIIYPITWLLTGAMVTTAYIIVRKREFSVLDAR